MYMCDCLLEFTKWVNCVVIYHKPSRKEQELKTSVLGTTKIWTNMFKISLYLAIVPFLFATITSISINTFLQKLLVNNALPWLVQGSEFNTGAQLCPWLGIVWGIHVNTWLIQVNIWQKPLQYCKVISLQLIKINEKKNLPLVAF